MNSFSRNIAILCIIILAMSSLLTLAYAAHRHGQELARAHNTIDALKAELADKNEELGNIYYKDFLKLPPADDATIKELNARNAK